MKEIKKLIQKLAVEIDKFMYDYDFYSYMDAVDERENGIQELAEIISEDEIDFFRIEDILEEAKKDPEWKARVINIQKDINEYRTLKYQKEVKK